MTGTFDTTKKDAILAVFNAQSEALKEAAALQRDVQQAVYDKRWTDFEDSHRALGVVTERIQKLEAERVALFGNGAGESEPAHTSAHNGAESSFYAYIAMLPREEREMLAASYRELKKNAARLRHSASAFERYLKEALSTVRGILEAAFPDRRGKLYGRFGALKTADMRSIVLNRQF